MINNIRLSQSVIGDLEIDAVKRVMELGYLGMGPEVGRFENDLEKFIGGNVKVACVNTGTSESSLESIINNRKSMQMF